MNILLTEKQFNYLFERVVNNSLPKSYVIPKILSMGFKTYENTNIDERNIFNVWYNSPNDVNEKSRFLFDFLNRCGWVCTSCGNYYDGLKSQIESITEKDPEASLYGTYVFRIEPNYPDELENFDKVKEHNDWEYEISVDNSFDYFYDENTLWHITLRKYLRRIMKNGLMPKNGQTITRWRNTRDRLYFSLMPDFSKIDYLDDDDEQSGDDYVLLKIDISSLKDKIKFYEDDAYENAVFTYSIIPPQYITIIDGKQNDIMREELFLASHFDKMMEEIMKVNKGYSEEDILEYERAYLKNQLFKLYPLCHEKKRYSYETLNDILDRLIDAKLKRIQS